MTNITTIWGGGGTFNLLLGLKSIPNTNISALITMADDGGSAGQCRDEFGVLPPWDVRRALAALARDTTSVRRLFEYRFKEGSTIGNHTIGNLMLTALADMHGDFEKAISDLATMFDVSGRVIPVTLSNIRLGVELEDGREIIGEHAVDARNSREGGAIVRSFLTGNPILNPRAFEAIQNADYIIIGPGDLYTSLVPNLLIPGLCEAIRNSSARVIYITNIMTKHGETDNFNVHEFVDVIESYVGKNEIDIVVANSGIIEEDLLKKYFETEKKSPVMIGDIAGFSHENYKIVERDLVNDTDFVRHHPLKLGAVMRDIVEGWVK